MVVPSDPDVGRLDERLSERWLSESEAVLWTVILVAATFDILTTLVGLEVGLREGNAVARAFIATYGPPGLGWLKFAALVVLALVWALLPERSARIVLTGFALVSMLVVAVNAMTLMGV